MPKIGNRVRETTTTTGTGTLNLAGAATGDRAFADEFTSGDTVYYAIVDDPSAVTAYEYGIGTYTAGTPDTLSRDTVYGSSNGGSNKVSFSAGSKTVTCSPLAEMFGREGPMDGWALKNPAVLAKTGAYTIVAADNGKLIAADGSANSPAGLMLTLPAATAGFVAGVINTGSSGTVTVARAGSDLINGATTLTLTKPYDSAIFWSDGSAWYALPSSKLPADGTSGQVLTSNGAGAAPTFQALPSKSLITAGTQLVKTPFAINSQTVQAHGLGARPTRCVVELVCTTTDLGYSVGDRVEMPPSGNWAVDGSNCVVTLLRDAMNVTITISNDTVPTLANKSTKAKGNITAANWDLVVTPYLES